ncbi:hypothetical protein Tco_1440110 [Tanacetum coccineum]
MLHGATAVTVAVMIVPLHTIYLPVAGVASLTEAKALVKPIWGWKGTAGSIHTRQETRNLGLKKITDDKGPVPILFELDDKKTMMPLGGHASHWSNYLGELIREMPLYYPSWQKVPAERKAAIVTKIGTQFDLTPHMQSQRWADINAGIQQHLQKLYNTNKASLKAAHWVINPETGTYDVETIRQGRPESITLADWDAQIAFWNDPGSKPSVNIAKTEQKRHGMDELRRLERTRRSSYHLRDGTPLREEMVRMGLWLPITESGVPYTDEWCWCYADVALTWQQKLGVAKSDDKLSQMHDQFESSLEFGGASGSGGCQDDESGGDVDGDEDEEDDENNASIKITDDSIDTSTFNVNDIEKVEDSIEVKYVDELNDLNDNLKEMEKDKGEDDIPIENFNESVNDVQSKQHVVQEENKLVYFSNDDISSNLILKHEKKSISHQMWSEKKTEADHFNSFIDSTGLNDLPIRGRAFTWMNKAGTKLSKLDRFLISEAILEGYNNGRNLQSHKKFRHLKTKIKQWHVNIETSDRSKKQEALLDISTIDKKTKHDPTLIKDAFLNFYKDKFQAHDSQVVYPPLSHFTGLGPLDRHALEIQVSIEEIKTAIWDCDSNKALGPDGFSFAFVKKYWDIIKMDIFEYVNLFFVSSSMPQGANSSFFTLIPKVSNPLFIQDFRPILLIGIHYKIITKILANQLSKVIDKIVSHEQSAFISDCQILDGPIFLSEVIDWFKKFGSGLIRGVKIGHSDTTLSHLFYADDVIITTDWSACDLDNIIHDDVSIMARNSGCTPGSFPFTYLGLSIGCGRLTLLKAVLGSLGIYYFSIFKAPETVHHSLERASSTFFWSGTNDARKLAWYNRFYRLEQDKDCLIIDRIDNGQWRWNWSMTNLGARSLAYLRDMLIETSYADTNDMEDSCV